MKLDVIKQSNINSWCQRVLDLLDLTGAVYGITWNFPSSLNDSPLFLQMREEIGGQLVKLVDFMEYSRYFQEIYPSQGTQAMLTQETKKV